MTLGTWINRLTTLSTFYGGGSWLSFNPLVSITLTSRGSSITSPIAQSISSVMTIRTWTNTLQKLQSLYGSDAEFSPAATLEPTIIGVTGQMLTPYRGLVATGGQINSHHSTSAQFMARSRHQATQDITRIALRYGNWRCGSTGTNEPASGSTLTYEASVEYPVGTFTRITFGGTNQGVCASGADIDTDMVALGFTIPEGAIFFVQTYGVGTAGFDYIGDEAGDVSGNIDGGDKLQFGASIPNSVMATFADTTGATKPIVKPLAIYADNCAKPSILWIGDSRFWGDHSWFEYSGLRGEGPATLPMFGSINCGVWGDRMTNTVANFTKRSRQKDLCTTVIIENGINDLRSGGGNQTAAATVAQRETLAAFFTGKQVLGTTVWPQVSGTYTGDAGAGQTVNPNQAAMATFNDLVRAGITGYSGYFEVADALELSRNNGKLKARVTDDGLHGYEYACRKIKNLAMNPELVTLTGYTYTPLLNQDNLMDVSTAIQHGTPTIAINDAESNCLVVAGNGTTTGGLGIPITTVIGRSYRFRWGIQGSVSVSIGNSPGSSEHFTQTVASSTSTMEKTFVATATTTYLSAQRVSTSPATLYEPTYKEI